MRCRFLILLILCLPCFSSEVPLAIVSTLDGSLHALEIDTGKLVWSLDSADLSDSPLLSSSLHNIQIEDTEDGHVRIIPSLSGDLFKWTGQKLEQYPTSADVLLTTSTKLTEDTVAVGSITFQTTAVRVQSGNVAYRCTGSDSCVREDPDTVEATSDLLIVRNTQRTVRAVDEFTGRERWNFSVVDVDVTYSASRRSGYVAYYSPNPPVDTIVDPVRNPTPADSIDSCHSEVQIKVMTPEGAVFGVISSTDSSGAIVWRRQFESPIAHLWRYSCESLARLDLSDDGIVPDLQQWKNADVNKPPPALYLGLFKQQWYVQQYAPAKDRRTYGPVFYQPKDERPQLSWRPLLATSPSRTPYLNQNQPSTIVIGEHSHQDDVSYAESTALSIIDEPDYPFDGGMSFDRHDNPRRPPSPAFYFAPDFHETITITLDDIDQPDLPNDIFLEDFPQILAFLPVSLWYYWKQILSFGIAIGLLINIVLQVFQQYFGRQRAHIPPQNSTTLTNASTESNPPSPRKDSDTPKQFSLPPPRPSFNDNFQYMEKLGKGGFGQVYVAQHRVDLQKYAIKRIELPRNPESADKMRREVRALSCLNHVGIVRYYNSWEETMTAEESVNLGGLSVSLESIQSTTGFGDAIRKISSPSVPHGGSGDNKRGKSNLDVTSTDGVSVASVDKDNKESSTTDGGILFSADTEDSTGDLDEASSHVDYNQNERDTTSDGGIMFQHTGDCTHRSARCCPVRPDNETNSSKNALSSSNIPSETHSKQSLSIPKLKTFLFIQMELCRPNTLKDWLMDNSEERSRDLSLHIFHQVIEAVAYVHSAGHFHRDLKPSNIFFSQKEALVKIGDFGLVTTLEKPSDDSNGSEGAANVITRSNSTTATHTSRVGTRIYMSPEQYAGKPYDSKVDIYALGIILFELLRPFDTESQRITELRDIRKHVFPQPGDDSIYSDDDLVLVREMLSEEPSERPTVDDLCRHHIVRSYTPPEPSIRMKRLSTHRLAAHRNDAL